MKKLNNLITISIVVFLLSMSVATAFTFTDLFTGRETEDTTRTGSRDSGRTTTTETEDLDEETTEADEVGSLNLPTANFEYDLLSVDDETLEAVNSLKTYTGSLKEAKGLVSVWYTADFDSGKNNYIIEIGFDNDYTKFGQYILGGQKTRGTIWNLRLMFDNYNEALDTLYLIENYYKRYVINELSGISDLYLHFKSNDCDMMEIDSSNPNYDINFPEDKQVITQTCRVDMTKNSGDYFKIGGTFSFWPYSNGWEWKHD